MVCTEVDDASAFGALIMNGFARNLWHSFDEVTGFRKVTQVVAPHHSSHMDECYKQWKEAVMQVIGK